jgi:hypothetical protein
MRIRSAWLLAAVCVSFSAPVLAQRAEAPSLPLKRVRLYETGVGYFERDGAVGAGKVSLPVPAGHLDDALKTMVVLSGDKDTKVSGIEFGSSVSRNMARALAGVPSNGSADAPIDYHQLLGSMKGAAVELRTATGRTKGRLIDIQKETVRSCDTAPDGKERCRQEPSTTLMLLTDNAEIRRFRSAELRAVKPADPAFVARLGSALDALSQRGSQTRRNLELHAPKGQSVTLGYVAEAPVWRSSYRLVLDAASSQGTLQGWALLHNDTDEDWKQVRVELVNGRPDSFLFPLASPRYARRKLVTPQHRLSTVPQLLDKTVDNMWSVGDSHGAGGLGLSGVGQGGGGYGEGIGLGSVGTIGHGSGSGRLSSSLLSVGQLAGVAAADGVEAGAMFLYAMPSLVDLRAHGSALLPFVQQSLGAKRIAHFAHPGDAARSAVHLFNDGGQTLPAGTLALFDRGGFAGEAALSRTKPKESRIISYGYDLDVKLTTADADHHDEAKLLEFGGGKLTEHFVRHHRVSYELENRSGAARKIYLVLPYVMNAELSGSDGVVLDAEAGKALAVFDLAARAKAVRATKAKEGLVRGHEFKRLSSRRLAQLAEVGSLPAAQRAIVKRAASAMLAAETKQQEATRRKHQLASVANDIERLRAHLKALGSRRAKSANVLVRRLLRAEDKTRRLRGRRAVLLAEVERHQQRAEAVLLQLSGKKPI